jgi:hypothetical protein
MTIRFAKLLTRITMLRRGQLRLVEYVVAPQWMPITKRHLIRIGPLKIEW